MELLFDKINSYLNIAEANSAAWMINKKFQRDRMLWWVFPKNNSYYFLYSYSINFSCILPRTAFIIIFDKLLNLKFLMVKQGKKVWISKFLTNFVSYFTHTPVNRKSNLSNLTFKNVYIDYIEISIFLQQNSVWLYNYTCCHRTSVVYLRNCFSFSDKIFQISSEMMSFTKLFTFFGKIFFFINYITKILI